MAQLSDRAPPLFLKMPIEVESYSAGSFFVSIRLLSQEPACGFKFRALFLIRSIVEFAAPHLTIKSIQSAPGYLSLPCLRLANLGPQGRWPAFQSWKFIFPIKLEKGSNISMLGLFTIGENAFTELLDVKPEETYTVKLM